MTWPTGLPKRPVSPEDRDEMPEPSSPREAEAREALADELEALQPAAYSPPDDPHFIATLIMPKLTRDLIVAALRAVPDGAAWEPTLEQIDAALDAFRSDLGLERRMKAALIAASLPPATPPSDERAGVVEARQAAFQECAAIARRYDDCGASFIIEKIEEAALSPTNAPAAQDDPQ